MTLEEAKKQYPIGAKVVLHDRSIGTVKGHELYPDRSSTERASIWVIDQNNWDRQYDPDCEFITLIKNFWKKNRETT